MPKARNHPHHHSSAERKARASESGGLQFPQWRTVWRGWPAFQTPPGWETRSPADTLFGMAQGCPILALLIGLLLRGFVAIVLLAQVMRE